VDKIAVEVAAGKIVKVAGAMAVAILEAGRITEGAAQNLIGCKSILYFLLHLLEDLLSRSVCSESNSRCSNYFEIRNFILTDR
jgi:hypothetical protein